MYEREACRLPPYRGPDEGRVIKLKLNASITLVYRSTRLACENVEHSAKNGVDYAYNRRSYRDEAISSGEHGVPPRRTRNTRRSAPRDRIRSGSLIWERAVIQGISRRRVEKYYSI